MHASRNGIGVVSVGCACKMFWMSQTDFGVFLDKLVLLALSRHVVVLVKLMGPSCVPLCLQVVHCLCCKHTEPARLAIEWLQLTKLSWMAAVQC
jgi:hypothetical protein